MDEVTVIPTPARHDENFWSVVMAPVEPAWSEPGDDDTFEMDGKVLDAARPHRRGRRWSSRMTAEAPVRSSRCTTWHATSGSTYPSSMSTSRWCEGEASRSRSTKATMSGQAMKPMSGSP